MRSLRPLILSAALVLAAWPASSDAGEPTASKSAAKTTAQGGIQWFATWKQAKAEAKRTKRPILLTSAAPHCRNISGMW